MKNAAARLGSGVFFCGGRAAGRIDGLVVCVAFVPGAGRGPGRIFTWAGRVSGRIFPNLSAYFFLVMAIRHLAFRVAASLLGLASLVACSKEGDDEVIPPVVTQGMAFTVNGVPFRAQTFLARIMGTNAFVSGAATDTATTYSIRLEMPKRVGTYNLSDTTRASAFYTRGSTGLYADTTGIITVTAVSDTSITGTFDFVAKPDTGTVNVSITNGIFHTNY